MDLARIARHFGNELYKFAFPIYRPLYGAYKSRADRAERELLYQNLTPGAVVVDAGANIGIYSQFLASCVGASGVVHTFEPDPENFARLHGALVQFPNVKLNRLAVSDRTGESTLYVSENLNVDHRTYPTAGEDRRAISIHSTRLDDYFQLGDHVDVIKLDVQGFELHALQGAQRVLEENANVKILFEFWPYGLQQAGNSANELLAFLEERDFSIFLIKRADLIAWPHRSWIEPDPRVYFNLFAARQSAAAPD